MKKRCGVRNEVFPRGLNVAKDLLGLQDRPRTPSKRPLQARFVIIIGIEVENHEMATAPGDNNTQARPM